TALGLDGDAAGAARDQEERYARLVARAAGRARRDDEPVGAVAVEHVQLAAGERPPAAPALRARLAALVCVAAAGLLRGHPQAPLARDHRREVRPALRIAPAEQQRRRAEQQRA